MEYENKYASKGVAGSGLGLGIAGTALGLLNGNGLNGLFGGGCGCSEDHHVNRYELGLQQEIASKDARIGLLESNIYTDAKIADVYERLNIKINSIENQICQQKILRECAEITVCQRTCGQLAGYGKYGRFPYPSECLPIVFPDVSQMRKYVSYPEDSCI